MKYKSYDTLTETMKALKDQGYTHSFDFVKGHLRCTEIMTYIAADELQIDQIHRFEGQSSTDDSSILYAVSIPGKQIKGMLVDAYGVYAEYSISEINQKLVIFHRD